VSIMGSNIWSFLWSFVRIAIVIYLVLVILMVVFQSRFIYFPERRIYETPRIIGLPFEDVSFEASDGVKLSGWFIPAEKPAGVILFCHGNAGNISHRLDSIQIFHSLGLSTFIFDYRGFGQSDGKVTEKGTYLDAEAAWNYLVGKKQAAPSEIIIFGRSLGGAVASWLAKEHTPKGLIIESTFSSVQDIAADLYPYLPVKLLARFHYNAVDYIRRVKCPLMVIHSRNDDIIPFKHGRRLFEAAHEPKEFLEITGSHNEGFLTSGGFYVDGLNSFISKLRK